MRLFLLVASVSTMFVLPLWPAYGEAMARGDVQWVKRTIVRSLIISLLIFGPIAAGLAAFGKLIVHVWVGPEIQPPYMLLLGMATWTVFAVVGNALATFFSGTNFLKVQVLTAILMAITNLILKIIAAKHLGLWAMPWATVLSSIPSCVLQLWYAHRLLTRSDLFASKLAAVQGS
jgi:O-antigen/teichoic acid export membrane protein